MSPRTLSLAEARRIALAAQGFSKPRPRGRVDLRHVRRTIQRLGLIQIDYVNVLTPAHYQVPFSRLGAYSKLLLDDLVYRKREFTEHWAHEASIVPVEIWPLLRYRMERHRVRPWGFEKFLDKYPDYVSWVLEQIRERGPLAAGDLPELDTIPRRMLDRWGWGMAVKKSVLEAHFGFGRLAAAGRLPSRVGRVQGDPPAELGLPRHPADVATIRSGSGGTRLPYAGLDRAGAWVGVREAVSGE